jgi:pilus assembly protein Flp/PilA
MTKTVRKALMAGFARLRRSEDGAAALEYGLLAALIACVLVTALTTIGSSLDGTLSRVASAVSGA